MERFFGVGTVYPSVPGSRFAMVNLLRERDRHVQCKVGRRLSHVDVVTARHRDERAVKKNLKGRERNLHGDFLRGRRCQHHSSETPQLFGRFSRVARIVNVYLDDVSSRSRPGVRDGQVHDVGRGRATEARLRQRERGKGASPRGPGTSDNRAPGPTLRCRTPPPNRRPGTMRATTLAPAPHFLEK